MPVNIKDKELMLFKNSISDKESLWLTQDIVVPDSKPDVVQILFSQVTPYIASSEVLDSKVNMTLKVNYFIIYKTADEKYPTRGIFASYESKETLQVPGLKKDMNIIIKPKVKNVITSLPNERKISVKTEIEFKLLAKDVVSIRLINDFEAENNIEKKQVSEVFSNIIMNKRSIIASHDDILLPKESEDLFEVLRFDSNIENTEIKESFNKVMLKGDLKLKLVYLSENREEGVKTANFTVPFTGMVEFENINDKSKFDVEYQVQDLVVTENSDITSTKALSVEYRILTDITMYEKEEVSYIEDFYSQYEDLSYEQREEDVIKEVNNSQVSDTVKESISSFFLDNKLIDYTVDLNNVTNSITANGIRLNGNAKIEVMLQDLKSYDISSKSVDVLIDKELRIEEADLAGNNDVYIYLKDSNITQNENTLDISLNIGANISSKRSGSVRIIDKLDTKEINLDNIDSMNIYIVRKDDDLWNIAKKYKTSISNIEKINNELRDENLKAGQKILIIR